MSMANIQPSSDFKSCLPLSPEVQFSLLILLRTNALIFGLETVVTISMTLPKIQAQNVSNSPANFAMQNKSKM